MWKGQKWIVNKQITDSGVEQVEIYGKNRIYTAFWYILLEVELTA